MSRARSLIGLAVFVLSASLALAGSTSGTAGPAVPSAAAPIAVGIDLGGGPYVTAYDGSGRWRTGFLPYFDFTQGGINVAAGDVDGDGSADILTVPGRGGRGEIREFDGDGTRKGPAPLATASGCGTRIASGDVNGDGKADIVTSFEICSSDVQVFDGTSGRRIAGFRGFNTNATIGNGVRVATGDVNGDGRAEVIVAGGPGDPGTVQIFPGTPSDASPQPLRTIDAFGSTSTNGVEVASADVNTDGKADVIVGAETPDGAEIKVYNGATGVLKGAFQPFGLVAADTLRIAAGDLDGDGTPEIVVSAGPSYSPQIRIFAPDGSRIADFSAPSYNGRSLAIGDVDGDGTAEIELGSGPSYGSSVAVFDETGTLETSFQPYGYSFTNGVRVAVGDLNGDGELEYVTGQGPWGESELNILDGQGNELRDLYPFGETWQGLYVAAGDVDGDGKDDVVAGAGQWEEPRVKVLDGEGREHASFLAFDPEFHGGVRVATGDLQGNGTASIVAGTGPGSAPVVRVLDGRGQRLLSFYAFDPSYTGGVYVAAGDLDGDGKAEIVVGSGTTGEVRVFDGNGHLRTSFQAYDVRNGYYDGTRVAVGDIDGDGVAEIVTGPGRVRPVDVNIFSGDGRQIGSFRANDQFQGGLYVAVPAPLGPRLADAFLGRLTAVEGHTVPLLATFRDPRSGSTPEAFGASLDWGDSESSQGVISALGNGRYQIAATHTYREFGHYNVLVRIADVHLRALTATTTATVRDARITGSGRNIHTRSLKWSGVLASVRDADPLGNPFDLHATIAWGDGHRSSGRVDVAPRGFRIFGRHRYRRAGSYRVVVSVKSSGGSTARAMSTIVVGAR